MGLVYSETLLPRNLLPAWVLEHLPLPSHTRDRLLACMSGCGDHQPGVSCRHSFIFFCTLASMLHLLPYWRGTQCHRASLRQRQNPPRVTDSARHVVLVRGTKRIIFVSHAYEAVHRALSPGDPRESFSYKDLVHRPTPPASS